MTEPTAGQAPTPRDAVRLALAHVVRLAGRELRLGAEATSADGMGRPFRIERGGHPVRVPTDALRHGYRPSPDADFPFRDEFEDDDLGKWAIRPEADGTVVLRAKRPPPMCLEAVFSAPADGLALLRALYRHEGIDVRVSCAGETRAREVALAFVAERRMLGLSTRHVPAPPDPNPYARSPVIPLADAYDLPAPDMPSWHVVEPKPEYRRSRYQGPTDPLPGGASRVHIHSCLYPPFDSEIARSVEGHAAPLVFLRVEVRDGEASASVHASPAARSLAEAAPPFADSPWDLHAARREARLKARPRKPATWHHTTAAVSDAFVARRTLRGFVGGRTLYFHGPVLYSLWDDNPIAAFVETRDGRPLVLTGRNRGGPRTSSQAGTVSGALNDLYSSAGEGRRTIDVEDLEPLVSVGGIRLSRIPGLVGRDKAEHTLPREGLVDPKALADWIALTHADALAELEAAYATRFPTARQAQAYRVLHAGAVRRDALAGALGLDLPHAGDAAVYAARLGQADAAAEARQRDLRERARLEREAGNAARTEEGAAPDDEDPDEDLPAPRCP